MNINTVLFDMDGLLLDTETLGVKVSVHAAQQQGIELSESLHFATLGTSYEETAARFLAVHPNIDMTRYRADYLRGLRDWVTRDGVPLKPHAAALLAWLKAHGYAMGLCSGSDRALVELYLRLADFAQYFPVIVAGDDGGLRSKPAPDMYLKGADLLNARPGHCLVLEDSPNGLRAGRAAGMHTVMVPDLIPFTRELAPYCDVVLDDLGGVPALLEPGACL